MATRDALRMDISADLERIDSAMTRVILDPTMSQDFKHDPNGVLVRVGMHPQTSAAVNDRVNRTFYAAMTNSEMNAVVHQHFSSFKPSDPERFQSQHLEGLDQGRIQNALEYDLEAADHLLTNKEVLTKVLLLFLHDLNKKGILHKKHESEAIDSFVAGMVTAITERKPISEHPVLEEWDRNYGVGGFHFGAEAVEVGPVATAYTAVEVGLFVTVAVAEAALPSSASFVRALAGDRNHMTRLATMSKVLQFRSDLMLHAYQFEGRHS
jgi:hypothetical protein